MSAPSPEPSPSYTVQIDNVRVPPTTAGGEIKTGAWDAEFCGCFTHCVPNCCMVSFCPCISMAQISARVNSSSFCCSVLWHCLGVCSGAVFFSCCVCNLRGQVRAKYQIPGGCCGDCLAACCCPCCTVAQMATHVKSYKPGNCSFGAPDTLPGFR